MLTEWEEKAMKKGIIQGMERGLARGKRETLLRLMTRKFGNLPESVIAHLQDMDKAEALDELADRVIDADTLEDMRIGEI